MNVLIVRKTYAELAQDNEVFAENVLIAETDFEGPNRIDNGKVKLGDGVRNYLSLPYFNPSAPYDLSRQVAGKPASSALILQFVAVRPFTLGAALHQGLARVAATAQADFVVAVDGVTKATLRFAAAGTVATIVGGTEAGVVEGNVVTITSPVQDATLEDVTFTLFGTTSA